VNKKFGLVAACWVDGNPVHLISSADTHELTTVQRRVGGDKSAFTAPEIVKNYNNGMDGVDRHDQYRALFSLCTRHGFKKYYVKLFLALVYMAVTNASLLFKMRWRNTEGSTGSALSRADFMQQIASTLMSPDRKWEAEQTDVRLKGSQEPIMVVPRIL